MQGLTHQSDHALVDAVVAGNKAAFAELVRRYEPVARAAAVSILHDTHLAQDVLQETFLRAYTNLGKLADRSRFGPWVLRIARRQALRTRSRRRYIDVALKPDELQAAAECNGQLDEDSRELLDAVGRLPDHEQVAVVLHYFEAHKVETIAQMTGRTTGTVTKQLAPGPAPARTMAAEDRPMNKSIDKIEERLGRLGERLAEQPSMVDRVMGEVDRAEPVRMPRLNQRRILTMLRKPRSLAAAAAMLALVVFGLGPWGTNRENGPGAWWLAPPSAWAGELQAAIEEASQQRFSCREQFVNLTAEGSQATSTTTSTLFAAGNQYRRDTYDQGRLRESQWYVQSADGLTMTSVRYNDKTYTVTHDPKARQKDVDPMARLEALAQLLDESGRRIGTARVEGREAVEFEIAAKKIDAQVDDAMMHVWLDQATKMPLKITYQFAAHGGLGPIVATILVQDHFDWNPTLPANTFEPEIPAGLTKVESQ